VLKSSGFAIDVSKRKPISRLTFVRLSIVAIRDLQEIEAHWGTVVTERGVGSLNDDITVRNARKDSNLRPRMPSAPNNATLFRDVVDAASDYPQEQSASRPAAHEFWPNLAARETTGVKPIEPS
jgi:hypothetical protein